MNETRESLGARQDLLVLIVDEATYYSFLTRLGATPGGNQKLEALLRSKAPWER